ncbi:MAG: tetratricopeptide (TPR) repeat protein, partial [Planctomycetota bacterium]
MLMIFKTTALITCMWSPSLLAQESPTWSSDVAAIVHRSCASCHRPGQPAPFSLLSYGDVFKKRAFVAEVTASGYMPPWQPTHGDFVGDRRLSKQDLATIKSWVAAGAPRGDESMEPKAPKFSDGWQLGEPDAIIRMPDVLEVPASGADIVRNFVVPIAIERMRYVAAVEIRPGNRAVHHAVLGVDRTRQSRQTDKAWPGPGFSGMTLGAASPPDGHFMGWTPGKSVRRNPDGMAWRLFPGDDFVLQLHAVPVGKLELVQPEIGIWFTDVPTRNVFDLVMLFSEEIDVAPGVADFVLRDHLVLPTAVRLHAVYPHAHYVCRKMQATATLPGGEVKELFAIDEWDFDWQDEYRFQQPIDLPAGTLVSIEYVYDNSENNDNNPVRPLQRVRFGQQSADEMGTCTFSLTLGDLRDRPKLQLATTDRDLEKIPNAWNLLMRKSQLERDRGNFVIAEKAIEKACKISPGAAAVWFERGMLGESMHKLETAASSYQQALRIDKNHAMAHMQLGTLFGRSGNDAKALLHFGEAVRVLPNSPRAHNNFATANFAANKLDVAERHYRRAVVLQPTYFNAQFNLARVLVGMGRKEAARKELKRAAELRPREPAVMQLLKQL